MVARKFVRIVVGASIVLTGCTALIGVNDIFLDPSAGAEGGVPEGGGAETSVPDGSVDASTCSADLNTSKQHCGRCGHDCQGGDCLNAQCQPIPLLNALPGPYDFALDSTYAYVANNNDGSIIRIERSGTGTPKTVATGLGSSLFSVGVSGTTLFWSSETSLDDAGIGGGLYMCALPDCTDKKRISTIGETRHIAVKDGYVYFPADDGVRRVKVDGTGEMILANDSNRPFSVAADSTNVYFSSNEASLRRLPLTGGAGEFLGPQGDLNGFVALDDTRFFWTQSNGTDRAGLPQSAPKASPGSRTRYDSPKNINTIGIASDGTNVFIANDGAYDFQPVGNGSLITCPVAGCPDGGGPVLVDNLRGSGPIVLDGNTIFFLEYGGSAGNNGRLLKIAKP